MKKLILVRHGKSSWKEPELADLDRPLNKRGKHDAPRMGRRLASRRLKPDRLVSSPAKRAVSTARRVAKEMGYPRKGIELEDRVYEASHRELLEVVKGWDDSLNVVMLFGHNPGFTDLANHLGSEFIENVPTCGIVELTFKIDSWELVGQEKAAEMDFDYPKRVDD